MSKLKSRRDFIGVLSALTASAILTACGDSKSSPTRPASQATTGSTTSASATTAASASSQPHWAYNGAEGPDHWGDIDSSYALCKTGQNQTPIDMTDTGKQSTFKKIEHNYNSTNLNLVNNGHTIQINYDTGSSMTLDGKKYDLLQFHFHSPSEHTIGGKVFAMELHLVHQAADKSLAVLGILLEEGAENPFLAKFWKDLPAKEGSTSLKNAVNVKEALPGETAYFTYNGSLTTPPCSEGVTWLVLRTPISVSKAQVDRFVSIVGQNARPLQPLNSREYAEGD